MAEVLMRNVLERLRDAPGITRAGAQPRAGLWIPLLAAVLLLPFANGGHSIALAAWLAPVFMLRFTHSHLAGVRLTVAFVVQVAALAVQFRGMVPFPLAIYAVVMISYGICFTLPYLTDRLLGRRLPG